MVGQLTALFSFWRLHRQVFHSRKSQEVSNARLGRDKARLQQKTYMSGPATIDAWGALSLVQKKKDPTGLKSGGKDRMSKKHSTFPLLFSLNFIIPPAAWVGGKARRARGRNFNFGLLPFSPSSRSNGLEDLFPPFLGGDADAATSDHWESNKNPKVFKSRSHKDVNFIAHIVQLVKYDKNKNKTSR